MRKIVLAFDGAHYSKGALDFANQLNRRNPILLTAAFLPQTILANLWSYSGGGLTGQDFIPLIEDIDAEIVKKNIDRFETYCIDNSIEYRVHKDYFDLALPEMKKETRFADLLILSSETFYESVGGPKINEYLEEALHGIECPVIVIPEKFEFPACNILTYDGSESSVYAIKQYSYLLPELTDLETTLVYAKHNGDTELPNELNIQELVGRHFINLNLFRFDANPKKYFYTWLLEKKAGIVVTGSFGRSAISRLFHRSFAAEIIRDHRLPVFIAHK